MGYSSKRQSRRTLYYDEGRLTIMGKIDILKKLIKVVAPKVATGLGGPLLGTTVSFLADNLLPNAPKAKTTGGKIKEVTKYIEAGLDPEKLAKLKEVNNSFDIKMKELNIDLEELEIEQEKIDAADRESARAMQKETESQVPEALALITVGGYFVLLYCMFSGDIKISEGLENIAMIMIGALIASVERIYNFYFGSSKGSKDKTKALHSATGRS